MHKERDLLEAYLAGTASEPAGDANLQQLLQAAESVRQLAAVEPSTAAVERARTALRLAPDRKPRPFHTPGWLWRRPAVALAFAAMLLAFGTTSVFASAGALPDSPLYAVRNLREGLQVRLAGSSAQRASLYAAFAEERSSQLSQLARDRALRSDVAGTLLRDITTRVHQANQEAHADGPSARSAVAQVEGQIGQQLNQVQQEAGMSQDESLKNAIREVESSQSGTAGGGETNQP
jgi:hypothetical protein